MKSGEQPPVLEAFKITNWDDVQLQSMKFRKIKHSIRHPYALKMTGYDLSKLIEVEVEGELKNGVPHGKCFLFFTYKGELESNYEAPTSIPSSPFSDGQHLTFRGTGVFVDGVLSGGPTLFITGNGWAISFSWMKDGSPCDGS